MLAAASGCNLVMPSSLLRDHVKRNSDLGKKAKVRRRFIRACVCAHVSITNLNVCMLPNLYAAGHWRGEVCSWRTHNWNDRSPYENGCCRSRKRVGYRWFPSHEEAGTSAASDWLGTACTCSHSGRLESRAAYRRSAVWPRDTTSLPHQFCPAKRPRYLGQVLIVFSATYEKKEETVNFACCHHIFFDLKCLAESFLSHARLTRRSEDNDSTLLSYRMNAQHLHFPSVDEFYEEQEKMFRLSPISLSFWLS